jgi:hypothetical protein
MRKYIATVTVTETYEVEVETDGSTWDAKEDAVHDCRPHIPIKHKVTCIGIRRA